MRNIVVDLTPGKGVLWHKTPEVESDGTLVVAQFLGKKEDLSEKVASSFSSIAFAPAGDR